MPQVTECKVFFTLLTRPLCMSKKYIGYKKKANGNAEVILANGKTYKQVANEFIKKCRARGIKVDAKKMRNSAVFRNELALCDIASAWLKRNKA